MPPWCPVERGSQLSRRGQGLELSDSWRWRSGLLARAAVIAASSCVPAAASLLLASSSCSQLLGHLPQPGRFVLRGGRSRKRVNNPPICPHPPHPPPPRLLHWPGPGSHSGEGSRTQLWNRPPVPPAHPRLPLEGAISPKTDPAAGQGQCLKTSGDKAGPQRVKRQKRRDVPFVLQDLY